MCAYVVVAAFLAYGLAGILLSSRMLKHRRGGQRLLPWEVMRDESYTAEGQRLLRVFRRGWGGARVLWVPFLFVVVGSLLCALTAWLGLGP